jgi:hypothetical protein
VDPRAGLDNGEVKILDLTGTHSWGSVAFLHRNRKLLDVSLSRGPVVPHVGNGALSVPGLQCRVVT